MYPQLKKMILTGNLEKGEMGKAGRNMRISIFLLVSYLLFFGLVELGPCAEEIPFTTYDQSIPLRVKGKEYRCPTLIKIRFLPDGNLFKTDFSIDSDLRSVYADLENILTDVKKDKNGEYIRLYDVRRSFDGHRIIVKSKTDYKRGIIGNLKVEQSVESLVALFPEYSDGVLGFGYEILDAKFDGVGKNLTPEASKSLLALIFDLLIRTKIQYRFPQEYIDMKIKGDINFVPKNGEFLGLQAEGSAWLTPKQLNLLVKRLSEKVPHN